LSKKKFQVCEVCGITSDETRVNFREKYNMILCVKHYQQLKNHGTLKPNLERNRRLHNEIKIRYCEVCGISNKETKVYHYKKYNMTLCNKHFCQMREYGKILNKTRMELNDYILYDTYAEIILYDKNNEEKSRAIIDIEDVDKCKYYRWGCNGGKYSITIVDKKVLQLQNFILDYEGKIDHRNRNPLDNRKENLRYATHQENNRNVTKAKNKSSDYIGITYDKEKDKWRARINIGNNNVIHLGYYENIDDAIIERLKAEKKYFKEFAPQQHLYEEYGIV